MDDYTKKIQEGTFADRGDTLFNQATRDKYIREAINQSAGAFDNSGSDIIGTSQPTSCIGQEGCAVGFSCVGGFCVQSTTPDSGQGSGCGTGGTGDDRFDPGGDYGCIQVSGGSGSGGCTTGTCGDLGGDGPGGAEWCCGDWVCDQQDADGNVKCRCVPRDVVTCGTDEDCPEGEKCVDGFCFWDFCDCDTDGDCPEGYSCFGCICLFDYGLATCETDEDCEEGYNCVGGYCFPKYGCDTDDDCEAPETCIDGFCYFSCNEDADCPPGEICSDGFCFAGCSSDDACPDGEICLNGFCLSGCREDAECPEGYECSNGFCFPLFSECSEDSQCGLYEQCVNGLCFPVPRVCDDERGCAPGTICINGFCVPEVEIPICGTLDFDDCNAVDAAKNSGECRWISETDTYGSCGSDDNRVGCFAKDSSGNYTGQIVWGDALRYSGGKTYMFTATGTNDKGELTGTWADSSCGGGDGGGGGGGPDGGGGSQCDPFCSEAVNAALNPDYCDGKQSCDRCQYCNSGICVDYSEGEGPCYCNSNRCPECLTCQDDGICKLTDETNCLVCCEVCRSCPDFSGDGFADRACKTVCVKKSELGDGSPCSPPTCPPPEPPRDCEKCTSTSVCGPIAGGAPSCPPGYSSRGTISAGGEICNICEKCDDSDCPPPEPPEPCDCNCNDDCGDCQICDTAGKCVPDPECEKARTTWFKAAINYTRSGCSYSPSLDEGGCVNPGPATTNEVNITTSCGKLPHTIVQTRSMDQQPYGPCVTGDTTTSWRIKDADGNWISSEFSQAGVVGTFCSDLDTSAPPAIVDAEKC